MAVHTLSARPHNQRGGSVLAGFPCKRIVARARTMSSACAWHPCPGREGASRRSTGAGGGARARRAPAGCAARAWTAPACTAGWRARSSPGTWCSTRPSGPAAPGCCPRRAPAGSACPRRARLRARARPRRAARRGAAALPPFKGMRGKQPGAAAASESKASGKRCAQPDLGQRQRQAPSVGCLGCVRVSLGRGNPITGIQCALGSTDADYPRHWLTDGKGCAITWVAQHR
jgi:hypothetical protein